jgi:lipopolysaccharide export system protein LptA
MPASFVPMMRQPSPPPLPLRHRWLALGLLALTLAAGPAVAEKADRGKPMEVQADKSGTADLQSQVSRFSGNVVITQGTMVIKADRVEIRQTPDGYHQATAWGASGAPVSYRQKRDGVDEHVEGVADRVEYDGKAEVLRFIGNSVVRRLRGKEMVDEITGSLITWNHAAEQFSVQGGTPTASSPSGRVRAVLGPRPAAEAASRPAR